MNTELYIENFHLDITADLSALLTFAIDDIKDFSARSTTWSKTIVLPGTSNNNKLFGHIFQIGQTNEFNEALDNVGYNFNASKSADCIIFQDQIQTFKGVLRLMQINITNGRIEYEVSVFGKLAGLNSALSGGLLEDLDFSAYDHTFNGAAISNSWENTSGAGYYYPLIDYGTYSTNKHDWEIRTFRPALFVREYIDKMFNAAGYRWSSDLFDSDRFKKLIIPQNKKDFTITSSSLVSATITSTKNVVHANLFDRYFVPFDTVTGTGFTPNGGNTVFTYAGTVTSIVNITYNFEGTFTGGGFFPTIQLLVFKNTEAGTVVVNSFTFFNPFQFAGTVSINVDPGDTLEFQLTGFYTLSLTAASFSIASTSGTPIPISYGDTVIINENIPKNVRQIDFLVGIVKMFNLYVYEDKFDPSLIYFKPYVDYYSTDTSNSVDWTYKLNRDKAIKIKPMSELNAKLYNFKFKQDSDYYNELYRKRYGQGYGDYVFDSEFEFAEQVKQFEILFSSTPLVGYGGEDKVYPTIFKRTGPEGSAVEERTDSNIRILQTKKVVGVTLWDMMNGLSSVGSFTKYGYAGHLNDPDAPSDDINFGALRELFFILATGNLSNTQFNIYWSSYMAEITDKDSKLVTANFYLTPKDIVDLDFSTFIYLDGVLFRLNKIKDYNASKPMDCQVELLKVNFANYGSTGSGESPPIGNFLLWANDEILDWDTGEAITYN